MSDVKEISIVIPVFNEEDSILPLYNIIKSELEKSGEVLSEPSQIA